jgi:hypothetical protein
MEKHTLKTESSIPCLSLPVSILCLFLALSRYPSYCFVGGGSSQRYATLLNGDAFTQLGIALKQARAGISELGTFLPQ